MKKLLACFGLVMAIASSGCTLYFGEDNDDDVQVTHYCEGTGGNTTCYTCYTQPDGYQECFPDGYGCTSDNGCASGCYCDESNGTCVEAGYCADDAQCGYGMECDCSGSCVPTGSENRSCNPNSCWSTGCPQGYVCTAEGACVPNNPPPPPTCQSDAECAAGCYCQNGSCEESSVCSSDAQCPMGQTCDEPRSTCVPVTEPPPPPPPPACNTITDQMSCDARMDCRSVISGSDCHRPDGTTCQAGDQSCVCSPPFVFQACVAR